MIMLSPGTYTKEEDFSLYAQRLATSTCALVTTATKGPLNQITLCTDEAQLNSIFGPPSYPHYGLYAGVAYLRRGRQLKVVRVGTYEQTAVCPKFDSDLGTTAFRAFALSPGTWSNKISIVTRAGFVSGTCKIVVLYNNAVMEVYDRVRIGSANEDHQDYIETRINAVSQYITVQAYDVTTIKTGVTRAFSGGSDGAPASMLDIIGVTGEPPVVPTTGLQLFADPETVDINMLMVPGYPQDSINREVITICEDRKDCVGYIHAPDMLTLMQVVDWHNGVLAGGDDYPSAAYNTSYSALFYPWLEVTDQWNNQDIWVPPSGHMAQLTANCDEVADPWWSMAGLNRGMLSDVKDVRTRLRRGEQDYMYSGGNAVNMILNKAGKGIVLMGQRTLQRKPSALDRLNVRRLMCVVEKLTVSVVDYLVHEPNDRFSWNRFLNYVEPVMDVIKARRGVTDYRVLCDDSTNPAALIDRNEMHGRVMLRPTKAAEFVGVTFTILGNTVSFEEILG